MTKRKRKIIKGNETNLDGCWWGFRNAVRPQRCNVIVVIIVSIRLPPTVPATLHHSFSSSCLFSLSLSLSLFFYYRCPPPFTDSRKQGVAVWCIKFSPMVRVVAGGSWTRPSYTYVQANLIFFLETTSLYWMCYVSCPFLCVCVCRNSR